MFQNSSQVLFGICRSMEWKNEEKKKAIIHTANTQQIPRNILSWEFPSIPLSCLKNIDADHGQLRMQPWYPVPCLTSASQMSSMLLAMTLFLVMCSYMKIVVVPLKQRGMSITSTGFKKYPKIQEETHCSSQQEGWGLHTIQMLLIRLLRPTTST